MSTQQERAELRKLAEAAKGWSNIVEIRPATEDDPCTMGAMNDGEFYPVMTIQCEDYYVESLLLAKHIAAANPAKTLELLDDLDRQEAEIARLTVQAEQYKADAERHRWLRSGKYSIRFARSVLNDTPIGIDQAIDAAMKGQP